MQTKGQLISEVNTQLLKQVQLCEFKCYCGQTYGDQIIGICGKKLQLKLLEQKDKKLEDIINECKTFELAAKSNELVQNQIRALFNITNHLIVVPRKTS